MPPLAAATPTQVAGVCGRMLCCTVACVASLVCVVLSLRCSWFFRPPCYSESGLPIERRNGAFATVMTSRQQTRLRTELDHEHALSIFPARRGVWRNVWARDSRVCERGDTSCCGAAHRNSATAFSSSRYRHTTVDTRQATAGHTPLRLTASPIQDSIQDYQDVSYRKPHATATVGCHTLALQEAEDLVRLYSALGLAPPNDAL